MWGLHYPEMINTEKKNPNKRAYVCENILSKKIVWQFCTRLNKFIYFLIVDRGLCMCMCASSPHLMCMHVGAWSWHWVSSSIVLPFLLSLYGLSLNLELVLSARPAGQWTPKPTVSALSSAEFSEMATTNGLYMSCLDIQVLTLVHKSLHLCSRHMATWPIFSAPETFALKAGYIT